MCSEPPSRTLTLVVSSLMMPLASMSSAKPRRCSDVRRQPRALDSKLCLPYKPSSTSAKPLLAQATSFCCHAQAHLGGVAGAVHRHSINKACFGALRHDSFAMCRRIVEESLELYTCSASSPDSEMPAYARNGTIPRAYNELATLMSVTGVAPVAAGHASACSAIWGASSAAVLARMILAHLVVPCWSHIV